MSSAAPHTRLASVLALPALLCAVGAGWVSAQPGKPTGGTTDTTSLEGTIESVSPGGALTVKSTDGSTQLYRLVGKLFVHDGKPQPDDELSDLHRGMAVVVHYRTDGETRTAEEIDRLDGDGLRTTEGRVISIDRGRREIKVLLDDDKTETLRLTDRAAKSVGQDLDQSTNAPVVVYYTDEKGEKVVHYFKKK